MALRTCRFCGTSFEPLKPYFFWCSYACRQADPQDGRGFQRSREASYDIGYFDGYRRGYQQGLAEGRQHAGIPQSVFRAALQLCHPDRYQQTPLCAVATQVTRWLIEHREQPGEASQN
jgi:flagellar biosynthesis/type III secretory pathway protein FliH